MNPLISFRSCLLWAVALSSCGASTVLAEKQRRVPYTAAHSVVNPDYQRERLPSGGWKPETYAFGEGSLLDPSEKDESLTTLSFEEMCVLIADALLRENYVPTPGVEETDLAIIVSWGKTLPHSDGLKRLGLDGMSHVMSSVSQIQSDIGSRASLSGQAPSATAAESSQLSSLESEMTSMMMMQDMSDRARRKANDYNARLLGYAPALNDAYAFAPVGMHRSMLEDLLVEIETPRYFVILQAYDFRKLRENREKELLWMTRFSIRAKGRTFDEELADMAAAASTLFGQRSDGLKRRLSPGRGDPGEIKVIEVQE